MSAPLPSPSLLVPVFALPNVVLLPRAILPLHIFEPRYKEMVADAIASDRQIAMALLSPGWEKDYHGRPAIEPAVCIGTILTWERLDDGCYNLLLEGHTRARIVRHVWRKTYREADLQPLTQEPVLEIDLERQRAQLCELFGHGPLAHLAVSGQFRQVLSGPMSTADVADLLAFSLLEDVGLKQSLLAEADAGRRVRRTIAALGDMAERVRHGIRGFPADPAVN